MSIEYIYKPTDSALTLHVDGQSSRRLDSKLSDLSGNGKHGTINGAAYKTAPSGKSVLSFDGIDDYIRTPNIIRDVIGVEIDNSSITASLQWIDKDGNYITPNEAYFNNHEIFREIWACTLTADGVPTYGTTPSGAGLDLTGASGDVMSRYPNVQFKYELDGDFQRYWVAPFHSNHVGFSYHPNCYAGGGTLHDHWFSGVYKAHGYLDTSDSKFKLGSATNKQPITGEVAYPNCPNSGRFTIDDALLFARNKGAGWSISEIYSESLFQLLYYIRYGTRDSQAKSGLGIVYLASGTNFAGKNTGSDSINTNLDYWGTGKGTGPDGQVAISVLNRQNPWGNAWQYILGINVMTNGSCRVTKQNGTGIIAGTLPEGSYETLPGTLPLTDNYISKFQTDQLGALTFMPLATAGTGSTGACDYWSYPRNNPSILLSGGVWFHGLGAGVGCRDSTNAPTSYRTVGARLEFRP